MLLALAVGQALWQQRATERRPGARPGSEPGRRGAPAPYLLRAWPCLDDLHAAGRLPEEPTASGGTWS